MCFDDAVQKPEGDQRAKRLEPGGSHKHAVLKPCKTCTVVIIIKQYLDICAQFIIWFLKALILNIHRYGLIPGK